ncbi:MAG: sugar ABC transporter permease [Anaerolineales bacterium]|nr:sugar ABC transporter permease [Anaerolineales bacterium]
MFNKLSLHHRRQLWAYAFILIPLFFFLAIRIGPTLFALNISVREWNILSPEKPFVGLANFERIWQDFQNPKSVVRRAFQNTFAYVTIGVPVQLVLALAIALMLDRITKLVGFFRAIYFIPFVTSTVAISWVWRWMYQPRFGPINIFLSFLGLPEQNFLRNPDQALLSIVAVAIWQGLGFAIIIFLAGLKQIPQMYYEAARIDGASRGQLFRHVTLPLLNPTIVYVVVLQSIGFLRMFTQVINMTRQGDGGPLNSTVTVVLHMYREGFGRYKMGSAAALMVVLFLIIMVITLLQMRLLTRRVEY